ncbi:hypothetical protein GCM10010991_34280 [Gemmobacter aquaticus]|uniref:NnrT protein n=1 Tax=Gemmobacter aquaticus TaxID=490185 RepID=A0A917YM80_9RHOB|nr:hypothetical protein [Gemmobacter aquaticus]GGO37871.1 hypothetical protein GCM10010991_34280 [Gemmobacter aquaticus]
MAPATESLLKLGLILWPFATGAVAINLFLLGLIGVSMGLPPVTPIHALIWSIPLGIPATWGFAVWIRSLIREAEGHSAR